MCSPQRHRPAPSGFSLIEIVIALVILGILAIAGTNMITSGVFTNQTISNEKLAYSAARYALERMSREIREMKFDPNAGTAGAMVASIVNANTLSFTKTGLTPDTVVTLSYSNTLYGITLAYGNTDGQLLAKTNLPASLFSYYKANGTQMSTAELADLNYVVANLRYVGITFSVTPDGANNPLTLSNLIYLRNR